MINIFNPERKQILGLDLSDMSLKFVQFADSPGKVQAYADVSLAKEVLSGDRIRDPQVLIKTLRSALAKPKFGKVTTHQVVASLSETKSFVRVISMPAMSETEAAEAVNWEAEAYVPLPVSQVYLDWEILGPAPAAAEEAGGSGKMLVLIMAAPKDYVDDYVKVLKAAGLLPVALEVESQAIARSLMSSKDEAVLLADIDTVRTSLIISDQGALQFTSSVPTAGDVFTESIGKALGLKFADAEQIKREVGMAEDTATGAKIKKALVPVLNNLVTEIKNTIRFYEEHSPETKKISRLLLSGGSSKLKHLPSFLHEALTQGKQDYPLRSLRGLKVELGNPWVNVLKKGQTPPLSREESLSYATAIGLALREVN